MLRICLFTFKRWGERKRKDEKKKEKKKREKWQKGMKKRQKDSPVNRIQSENWNLSLALTLSCLIFNE